MKEEELLKALISVLLLFKDKKVSTSKSKEVENVEQGKENKTNNRFSHRGKNGRFESIKK